MAALAGEMPQLCTNSCCLLWIIAVREERPLGFALTGSVGNIFSSLFLLPLVLKEYTKPKKWQFLKTSKRIGYTESTACCAAELLLLMGTAAVPKFSATAADGNRVLCAAGREMSNTAPSGLKVHPCAHAQWHFWEQEPLSTTAAMLCKQESGQHKAS